MFVQSTHLKKTMPLFLADQISGNNYAPLDLNPLIASFAFMRM